MPSLFSRLKHRKTPSSSSELNSPSSPTIVQSPTSPARTTAAAPPSQERLTSLSAPVLDRSDEDVVLIDKAPVPASSQPRTTDSRGGRTAPPLVKETASPATFQPRTDPTGHSQAFVDEFQQPDLPTTSSNANNPIPDDNANYVSNSLPKLLELPRDLSEPFTAFPLPPGAAPPSQSPTPIAHVTSANRTRITDAERERPKPMISGSQAIPEQEQGDVEGRFRHVQSIPGTHGGRKSEESGRRRNNDVKDIPARGVSLVANPQLASAGSTRPNTPPAAPTGPRESLRSVWGPDTDGSEHIERHIANLSLNQNSRVSYEPKSTAALEAQRDESVATIATAGPRNTLSERGKAVFRAAGLGDKLGKTDTVDVHTKWMEPVVQETVKRTEHTDTILFTDREIHKYHVYPKVQPIYDTEPLRLETRHRIFSQADGQWHEVIGDAAAIEILGEEAFYRGRKETRERRGMALPGLGGEMRNMTEDEMLSSGFGTGKGMGKVLEREGPLGGPLSQWREVGRRTGTNPGNSVRESRVGLAL